jgi:putative hydrolase of HD superfamily
MVTNNLDKIFDFLHLVGNLKKTKRYENYDIEADSSADHSWRVALMTFIIAEEINLNLNVLRAVKIALVHDLPEAITGDINYMKIANGEVSKRDKEKMEKNAMKRFKKMLPKKIGEEIYELWQEYEDGESKEALFVKALDKIETVSHAIENGIKYTDLDVIATYSNKHVNNFIQLKDVSRVLKKRLKKEFERKNLVWKKEYMDD